MAISAPGEPVEVIHLMPATKGIESITPSSPITTCYVSIVHASRSSHHEQCIPTASGSGVHSIVSACFQARRCRRSRPAKEASTMQPATPIILSNLSLLIILTRWSLPLALTLRIPST